MKMDKFLKGVGVLVVATGIAWLFTSVVQLKSKVDNLEDRYVTEEELKEILEDNNRTIRLIIRDEFYIITKNKEEKPQEYRIVHVGEKYNTDKWKCSLYSHESSDSLILVKK